MNNLGANEVVISDGQKKLVSEARKSAFNCNFGNSSTDVPRGNWVNSGSYFIEYTDAENISSYSFYTMHFTRIYKTFIVHGIMSAAAANANNMSRIDFYVPVIANFSYPGQVAGHAIPEAVGSQEHHPAIIYGLGGSKNVRVEWWATTTQVVNWSIIILGFDTGNI